MANVALPAVDNILTITVQGGSLFTIAALYLGDATQWNRIASLNGLADFLLPPNRVIVLKIPPVNAAAGNGGILGV